VTRQVLSRVASKKLRRLRTFKRRGCSTSKADRTPKPKPLWFRPVEEEFLIPVVVPSHEAMLEVTIAVLSGGS
jgi:hypothetical protein